MTWRGALFRTSRANRSDWADPARDHLDFLLDEYSPRGLYADIKAPGGDSGEKELERFGMGLERSLGTAAMAKEPASPWAVRQYSSGAEAQPRAGYAGVRWKISDQQRSEATQWVLFILVESARRTIRRGVAEIKSMQGRKFPDPALWMRHVPNEPPPAWMGGRERVSSLPSVSRASVLGVAGALFVICGYWLSRPSPNLINTVSPQVGAKPSAESGGSLKFGMALARANATEYATPSLVGGYVARPEVGAPLPNTFAANPSMNAGALRPKSAPNVEPSMSEAEVQALAAQGDPRAQYELATRLLMRQEKGPEAKVAAGWLEKAANQGFALAQLRLGILYGKGVGVNHDYALARKWFQAAAENGNALAMHNLAVLISEGHGRKPDPTSANAWFRKAAELGVVDSQYNLGLDYMDGLGVEKDLVQSYAWFAASAAAGDAKASKKRKEIAALLDPEELESARALANRLKQKQASMQADP